MQRALEAALSNAGVRLNQLDGLIAVPSLSEPHFMEVLINLCIKMSK